MNPLRLNRDPKALFDDAYQGKVDENAMRDFSQRTDQRDLILHKLKDPRLWFWTPAFDDVLNWLRQRLPVGSTVLDVGCGLGWFLHAMRNAGFDAVGLDVAETAVRQNREDGFQVWHGTLDSMPPAWVEPDAVVSFFMMHHLENPVGLLRTLREKAPGAPLAIAEYGPTNRGLDASQPPRTLSRWNGKSLVTALEGVGYKATAVDVRSNGVEHRAIQPIRRTLRRTMSWPSVYRVGKRLEAALMVRVPERARQDAYVVLGYADPLDREPPESDVLSRST